MFDRKMDESPGDCWRSVSSASGASTPAEGCSPTPFGPSESPFAFPKLGTPYTNKQASRVPSTRSSSSGELSPRATALSPGALSPCVHDATPVPNDDPDLVVTYADRSVSPDNFYDDGGYEHDGKTSAKEYLFERLPVVRENTSSVLMFCAGTLSIILGIWMQIEAVKTARNRQTYSFNTRAEEPPVLLSRAIPTVDGPHKPASPLTQLSQLLQLEAPRDASAAFSQDASRCLVESYPSLAAISTHVRVAPTYFLRGYAAQAWMRPPIAAKHIDVPVAALNVVLSQAHLQLQPKAQAQAQAQTQAQAQPATEAAEATGKTSGVTSAQRPRPRGSAGSSRDKVRKVLGRGSSLPALGSSAASFSSSSGLYAEANSDLVFSEAALDAGAGKALLTQQGDGGLSPRPGWSWHGQWSLGSAWSSAHPSSSSSRPVFVALAPLAIAPPKGSLQSLTLQLAAKGFPEDHRVLAAPFSLLVSVQGQGAKAIQLYNSAFFGPYDRPASGPASASSLKAGPKDPLLEQSVQDALSSSPSFSLSSISTSTSTTAGAGAVDFFIEDPERKGAFIRHGDLERRVHADQPSSSSSSSSFSSSSASTKAEAEVEVDGEALYESRALHAQQGLVEVIKLWAEIAAVAMKVIHRARLGMRTYLKKLASFEVFVGAVLKRVGRAGAFSGEW